MLPQFGAVTADSFSRATSLVLRIGTDAHLYDDPDDVNISHLLDSRFDSEKCEALKRLLALIAQGVDVCNFFPQVVKNVASKSFEVKKLVYLYLLHYAEKRPNEALLSINCFQKDLSDQNPLVRAWALRAMAGIHLHVVAPLVLAAIRKCARDPSAYVRKCAANALAKLLELLPEENNDLEEVLCNIQVFAKRLPSLFEHYYEDFFVLSSEFYQIKALKLEILSAIATDASIQFILDEFQDYIKDPDRRFVADTVAAIGLCAQKLPSVIDVCLKGLLGLASEESSINKVSQKDGEACIVVQAIMSIRFIIKHDPSKHEKVIARLARNLDVVKESAARSLIVWMVGEYCSIGQIIPEIIPTVLKYLAWSFTSEVLETKNQILNTAVKAVLSTRKEDRLILEKILSHVLQLAKCDTDYDIRDRARMAEKFVSWPAAEDGSSKLQNGVAANEHLNIMFRGNSIFPLFSDQNVQFYLPGSLSHVVLHAAPGYDPLPRPCSLHDILPSGTAVADDESDSKSFVDESDSKSFVDESGSYTDSEASDISSEGDSHALSNNKHISGDRTETQTSQADNLSTSIVTSDLADIMMSRTALESWLDEHSASPSAAKPKCARISVNDLSLTVSPILRTLLDPVKGKGLKVEYCFLSRALKLFPFLVCIELLFSNCSNEMMEGVTVEEDGELNKSSESSIQVLDGPESLAGAEIGSTVTPIEEIATLNSDQTIRRTIQARFPHHLLPLKMTVLSDGRRHSVNLWPEIGYFMNPLSMNTAAFSEKESELKGMFECSKRCMFESHLKDLKSNEEWSSSEGTDSILVVARSLASKVLSHSDTSLVSIDMPVSFGNDDASGLRLRFSGEIFRVSKPCLVTIVVEQGRCSQPLDVIVKINCEETVFSLNLLNRFVALLNGI